jgi:hypothetical protein
MNVGTKYATLEPMTLYRRQAIARPVDPSGGHAFNEDDD